MAAYAKVSGSLALDYAHYNAKEAGVEVADASSFAQRYSLMLEKNGEFMDGRGGRYGFMLGSEWLSVDANRDFGGVKTDINVDRAKLLFRGDILFAPGGLPVRFHAYGRDLKQTRLEADGFFGDGSFDNNYLLWNTRSILTPRVVNDISDGERVEYGASAILGIKNGSYLGRYRNILSHLPKLYFDYHEMNVRDLKAVSPEKYRDRELAFVSLNKKHNWFHYSFYDHRDYVNPTESFYKRTYLMGTIDQDKRRDWVNLTNWIQVSSDASYVAVTNPLKVTDNSRDYVINLFAKTQRSDWRSTTLARFWRSETAMELERVLDLPVYANGDAGRDNGWYLALVGRAEKHNRPFLLTNTETVKDDVYAKGRWEAHRSTPFTFASHLAAETKSGDYGTGRAVKAGVEYFTTKNKKAGYDLYSDLLAGYYWGEQPGVSGNDGFYEASGRFDLAKNLSSRSRAGLESKLVLGTGVVDGVVVEHIAPELAAAMPSAIEDATLSVDGTVWRGKAGVYYEHSSLGGLRNRVEAIIDHISLGSRGGTQTVVSHRLDQRKSLYNYRVLTELAFGDNINANVNSQAFGVILGGSSFKGVALINNAEFSFTPNRSHRLRATERSAWISQTGLDDGYQVGMSQNYTYTKYIYRGLVRRLFELNEYLDYEILTPNGQDKHQAISLTGAADYYPLKWMRLGSRLRWSRDIEAASDEVGAGFYSNLDFSRLSVALEYEYGLRTLGDNGLPLDRDEQSWKISVSKTF